MAEDTLKEKADDDDDMEHHTGVSIVAVDQSAIVRILSSPVLLEQFFGPCSATDSNCNRLVNLSLSTSTWVIPAIVRHPKH